MSADQTDLGTARRHAPGIARLLSRPLVVTEDAGRMLIGEEGVRGRIIARAPAAAIWADEAAADAPLSAAIGPLLGAPFSCPPLKQ